MGRKKAKSTGDIVPQVGRLRSAWYVLLGRARTIEQINGEWAIIQAQAAETFNRFNALAARLIRAERNMAAANVETLKRLEAGEGQVAPDSVTPVTQDRASYKADLRKRAAEARRQPIGRLRYVDGHQGGEVPR